MGDMGNMGDMSKEVKDGDKECHTCEREQMEGEEESGKQSIALVEQIPQKAFPLGQDFFLQNKRMFTN